MDNKEQVITPIQELIKNLIEYYEVRRLNEEYWEQKEKQFAKDCFDAGMQRGFDDTIYIYEEEKQYPNFENFYQKYE